MGPGPGRILLKLGGGLLAGAGGPLSPDTLSRLATEIVAAPTVELAIVVGGGNIVRGASAEWLDRVRADALGMIATVINALALQACLEREGRDVVVQSAVTAEGTETIDIRRAGDALSRGAVVIFAGGTGNPLVTTDTAAAIRAASIGANLLAKGSDVGGVYTGDPASHPDARRLQQIGYDDYLRERYRVMDQVAVEICRSHGIPITVFDATQPGAITSVLRGDPIDATRIA